MQELFDQQLHSTLKTYFGYDTFRPEQETIIRQILSGRDVFAVMPTGAGKSLCYQLPALMLPGITIVVSPLISLMIDQVKALNEAGVHAAYINSALTENQIAKAIELAKCGQYKMIYVAPERLETPRFLDFACHAEISMITVDEAHCISQWGQDFRPSYLKILSFVHMLPVRPVISAFTATATERVRNDIRFSLELEHPYETVTGFDRENLYFEVQRTKKKKEKIRRYLEEHREESGIIYCATRKGVDDLYLELENAGFSVGRYYAGMSTEARKISQEDFIYDRIRVMIATNAFGMGIDKSNVRFVLHFNMPQSMENYYQEAGRAGRDGEPAECILYYSPQDTVINRFLLESKEQDREYTEAELRTIQGQDMERLRKMEMYCTTTKCLRAYILRYFGEEAQEQCQNCSNCQEEFEEMDASKAAADVILCVRTSGQRFGMNMIAGTLLGENTAKIRNYRMEENPAYGKQSKLGQMRIKEIIRTMVERGYLRQTEDKYAILQLTETSGELMEGMTPFVIACKKEEEPKRSSKKSVLAMELSEQEKELFESLRELRAELARKRAIPPYMVASDKTLRDLCIRMPFTKEELLKVNGMGEKKIAQYGQAFLERIQKVTGGKREKDHDRHDGTFKPEANPLTEKTGKGRKEEFRMTREILSVIRYVPKTTMSDFVAQVNELRDEKRMKRLTNKWLTERLLEEGCLKKRFQNGFTSTVLTEKGRNAGIESAERISEKGNTYEIFFFTEKGQKHLVDLMRQGGDEV
nr:DNA helicase RecQ [uncultured Sellimonas sp.]